MKEIKVIYDPINGTVVPDGKISDYIDLVEDLVIVGSEIMLYELRARHAEGKLKITSLTFRQPADEFGDNDTVLQIDENACIDPWPKGFCDHTDKALERILEIQFG
jgi:hypothetical protein